MPFIVVIKLGKFYNTFKSAWNTEHVLLVFPLHCPPLSQLPPPAPRPSGALTCKNESFSLPIRLSPLHLIKGSQLPRMAEPLAGYLISLLGDNSLHHYQYNARVAHLGCRLFIAGRDNIFFPRNGSVFFCSPLFSSLAYSFYLYSSKQLDL